MSEEQLKAFLEAVKADIGLQEKLSVAKDVDAVVAIAKAAGFAISGDELKSAISAEANQARELSDKELESVCGGAGTQGDSCTGKCICPGETEASCVFAVLGTVAAAVGSSLLLK
jgi:predicted ribosomally synthesized peptide with nif11-like leader